MLTQFFMDRTHSAARGWCGLLLLALACAPLTSLAIEPGRHFIFQQGSVIGDLQCPVKNKINPAPLQQNKDILEPPDAEELDELGVLTARLAITAAQASDTTQIASVVTQPALLRSAFSKIRA